MALMRTNFYVPANNAVFMDKCAKYGADNITFDVEDAVPPQEKANARKMAREHLEAAHVNGASVYVRINGFHTEFADDDLEAVVYPGLDGVTLPKTRNKADVERLDATLTRLEKERGMEPGSVKIAVLLETAEGIMNANEIVHASDRLVAAFFGAVDYCCDLRITRTNLGAEQFVARTIVGIAARSAGLVALDAPFADFSNMEDFIQNTKDGCQMGFEGRMIIHPSQIPVAHELYSPTAEEVEYSKKVIKFFEEEGLAKGLASVSMDGKMVDTPVYTSAQNVVARYEEIKAQEAKMK